MPDVGRPHDLVVLSHLRWVWVWQRPQHLVSRLAVGRAAAGARTFFVEEPIATDVATPRLVQEDVGGGVVRVWLEIPRAPGGETFLPFGAAGTDDYGRLLGETVGAATDVWLYTPMALDVAATLRPRVLIYDVMDDLAAFAGAPPGLRLRHARALTEADVVFAGGLSLHRWASRQTQRPVHLFRSGVDMAHFAVPRSPRRGCPPVAGYVGVIDERIDHDLLAGLAARLPDWRIDLVGPVTKIDDSRLPRAANLRYLGMRNYADLPRLLAGFDTALMPFAVNEATRSISPTKTLEYLASGLPVVCTRVPDVVADHPDAVRFADDAAGFAAACRSSLRESPAERHRRTRSIRAQCGWDAIAAGMEQLVEAAIADAAGRAVRTGARK